MNARARRQSVKAASFRGVMAAGVLAGYAAGFVLLYPIVGSQVMLLGLIPAIVLGWTEGLLGGIVAGLVCVPLNALLSAALGFPFQTWGMVLGPEYACSTVTPIIVGGAIGRMRDVSRQLRKELDERARVEAALSEYRTAITRLVKYDVLTGLPNRHQFREQLVRALQQPEGGAGLSLLLIDLDRLREINNTFGHDIGDDVLRVASERLAQCLEPLDCLARIGGDEFGVLLDGGDHGRAIALADRLLAQLRRPLCLQNEKLDLDASIGIALFPDHASDAASLLRTADVALSVAKHDGHRRVVYAPGQEAHSPHRLALLSELRETITEGRLALYFQPKIDLHTRRVTGAEALVRWPSPTRGVLPPAQFIPLAEVAALIQPMTAWVLGSALGHCRQWRAQGLDLKVSVNLSCSCLDDPHLIGTIENLLESNEAEPGWLTIEVTEDVLLSDSPRVRKVLNHLQKAGITISIDDFGTGYSGLSYLKNLPIAELKIDRSFVMTMTQNPNDAIIVRSVIDLGRKLGVRVVAEGVEDRTTLDRLAEFGCDGVQGFLFSKPLPAEEFLEWMNSAKAGPRPRERTGSSSALAAPHVGRKAPSSSPPLPRI